MKKVLLHPLVISMVVLVIDQWSKIAVKTSMMLGEEFSIMGKWSYIHFTENPGMAYGIEFGGDYGKLFLTLFRIIAIIAIGFYLFKMLPKETKDGARAGIALIFSGAVGNLIDSIFYGKIFNDSYGQIANLFPSEGGYGKWLHGKVVDMFYFPMLDGHFPDWLPFWAGEHFIFFRPVFNVADAAISVGLGILLLFYRKDIFAK